MLRYLIAGMLVIAITVRTNAQMHTDTVIPQHLLKDSGQLSRFIDNKLRAFYTLPGNDLIPHSFALPAGINNQVKGISADVLYSNDSLGNVSGWWNNVSIQDQVSIGSIPFNIGYSGLAGQNQLNNSLNNDHLVKASFDRKAYLEKINDQLQSHYDLRKHFMNDIDFKAYLQSFINSRTGALQQQTDSMLKGTSQTFTPFVSTDQLIYWDSTQLKNTLLEKSGLSLEPNAIAEKKAVLERLQHTAVKDSAIQQLQEEVARYDAIRHYCDEVMQLKKEIGSGLNMDQLLQRQHAVKQQLGTWIGHPENAPKMAKDLLPMSFLQKLMMNFKNLDVGNISASASKGTVSDLFMSGVSGSLLSNNKFLMLGAGASGGMGNLRDMGLNNSISTPSYAMQYLRMGPGDIGKGHTHVTMLNANARNVSKRDFNTNVLSRNTFVGAVSKQISLGEWGRLDAEISKSMTQFSNAVADQGANTGASKAAVASFFGDFWATTSVGLRYSGDLKQVHQSHSIYLNYAGLGHTNPGNPYASRGTLQYGLSLKRSWLRNRASVYFRADARDMAQSPLSDSKWKNLQFALDGRYRLNRKLTMNLRFNQTAMREKTATRNTTVFMSRKIDAGSQLSAKLGTKPFFSNVLLGIQQLDYDAALQPVRSTLINVNLVHSLLLKSNMVTFNVWYNRDVKGNNPYGNLFTGDIGYTYTLWKKLVCSSALTFLDNSQVSRQLGLRQNAGMQFFKKWNLNLFMDGRKDLITPKLSYFYGNFRSELSLHYLLN